MSFDTRRPNHNLWNLFILAVVLMVQGCFHDDDPAPTPDADPTGYYNVGSITELTEFSNFQGLIHNNRIMFYDNNNTNDLAYDGTMTITGTSFTAVVSVFIDGFRVTDSATIKGTITEGSRIDGTITGAGSYNGTLRLDYADNNSDRADVTRLARLAGYWDMQDMSAGSPPPGITFTFDGTGTVTATDLVGSGSFFENCTLTSGAAEAIGGTNLYSFTITFADCTDTAAQGTYTGLASTRTETVSNDWLILQFSNGLRIVSGSFQ